MTELRCRICGSRLEWTRQQTPILEGFRRRYACECRRTQRVFDEPVQQVFVESASGREVVGERIDPE